MIIASWKGFTKYLSRQKNVWERKGSVLAKDNVVIMQWKVIWDKTLKKTLKLTNCSESIYYYKLGHGVKHLSTLFCVYLVS